MSTHGLRVDGYVRVSRVGNRGGERFISPGVQLQEIARWAFRHDADIVAVHEELDESGRRPDRPRLETIARRVELGVTGGLVVATVDRFGRSELDALLMIKRIQDAGGHFFSAREDFDLASEVGRYLCRELLSLAEFQSDRLSVGWRQAKDKMLERGAWPASHVPFGYRRTRSGRLTPDPKTGPYVTELYRRRSGGESIAQLCRFLEAEGVRSPHGNAGWALGSLENIFRHRAYLGEIHWGSSRRADAHPPLTDGATWERAQRPPTNHLRDPDRPGPLLRGLVRCASCSMSMAQRRVRVPNGRVYQSYDCIGRSSAGPCPARAYINAPPLEKYVVKTAFEVLKRRRSRSPVALIDAMRKLDEAERALRRDRDNDRLLKHLDAEVFTDGILLRDARVSEARLDVALAREADPLDGVPFAAELAQVWPTLSRAEQRATLARILDCVFVSPGRLPVEQRVTVCPVGTAPRDLPRSGDKRTKARPFRPRADGSGRRAGTRRPDRWSNARLERELQEFLDGRPHWPVAEVFVRAGKADVLQQARLRARDQWWAFHFHLPMQEPPGPVRPWTTDRLDELTAYLQDKPCWPTRDEFRAAGHGELHRAIAETGGLRTWAPRVPHVPCPQIHRWTEDAIRREIVAFCQGRSYFPTDAEFRAAGRAGLYRAMAVRGRDWWAAEVALPRARQRANAVAAASTVAPVG